MRTRPGRVNKVRNDMVQSPIQWRSALVWGPTPARSPSAGVVPGQWGACVAVRTPPAALHSSLLQQILRLVPGPERRPEVDRARLPGEYGPGHGVFMSRAPHRPVQRLGDRRAGAAFLAV